MRKVVNLSPPPTLVPSGLPFQWTSWFEQIFTRVGAGPLKVEGYSRLSLPTAGDWGSLVSGQEFSSVIFVYDATQGASLAYSDGANWLSVIDGLTV